MEGVIITNGMTIGWFI